MKKYTLSTEPYKGVRDFYPEDMAFRNFIFEHMRRVVESYGYLEYDASVLEPAELYRAKSGEEIVNEQMYVFTDRGDREVALRPEMTPTVSRMVAARARELPFPLRLYSIPNLYRYERPQKGRLREHWQLNVDLFGDKSPSADIEIIMIADSIMKSYGATSDMYQIQVYSREIANAVFEVLSINEDIAHKISKLIDKIKKISEDDFLQGLRDLIGEEKSKKLFKVLTITDIDTFATTLNLTQNKFQEIIAYLKNTITRLKDLGVSVSFDPTLMRGFDYYDGIIFELFDTHPENNRSLMGGGRYNGLVGMFGGDQIPAIGFGMGDVIIAHFLENHNLKPTYTPHIDLYLASFSDNEPEVNVTIDISTKLRKQGLRIYTDTTHKKIDTKIKNALKLKIPFIGFIGERELAEKFISIKNLQTEESHAISFNHVTDFIKNTV